MSPQIPGLSMVLTPESSSGQHQEADIMEDIEGEQETLPELSPDDFEPVEAEDSGIGSTHIAAWTKTVAGASKGVSDKTDGDYRRLIEACAAFLVSHHFIVKREDFFCVTPPENAPTLISAWIMNEGVLPTCDSIGLDGKPIPPNVARGSFAQAQKMRASITYAFGRIYGIGSQAWQRSVSGDGTVSKVGNPSISEEVARYLLSLRRRKAQLGETPTSARAITTEILESLYDFNHLPENWTLQPYKPGTRHAKDNVHHWGGPMTRRALQAIYALSFICLLRIDEALKIRMEHLEIFPNKIILTLPFRKTHQFGEIKPFVLHPLPPEEAHLCPFRAIGEWLQASGITTGYMFRRMASGERPSTQDSAMTSEQFLEKFRLNLLDIGIDYSPYGTHSFRRGGCQYFSSVRRWSLRRICDWGGWSAEFSSLTIVKYLISWNDNPTETRDDFLNPDRAPVVKCYYCGRTCECA